MYVCVRACVRECARMRHHAQLAQRPENERAEKRKETRTNSNSNARSSSMTLSSVWSGESPSGDDGLDSRGVTKSASRSTVQRVGAVGAVETWVNHDVADDAGSLSNQIILLSEHMRARACVVCGEEERGAVTGTESLDERRNACLQCCQLRFEHAAPRAQVECAVVPSVERERNLLSLAPFVSIVHGHRFEDVSNLHTKKNKKSREVEEEKDESNLFGKACTLKRHTRVMASESKQKAT